MRFIAARFLRRKNKNVDFTAKQLNVNGNILSSVVFGLRSAIVIVIKIPMKCLDANETSFISELKAISAQNVV